jgi:signal transduction histidine kinase
MPSSAPLLPILANLISELEAERRRVQLLYDISCQLTGEWDLPQALRNILLLGVAGVAGPEGGARGSILLLDEDGRPSDWVLTRDLPQERQNEMVEAALRGGLWGWIAQHRAIALVEDCWSDPRWLQFADDPRPSGSAIGAPLLVAGQVRGCLVLLHPERYFFGPGHIELMRAISSQAGAVLANALLYRRLGQQVKQLADANRLQSEFIANMSHELCTPLNAIIGFTELVYEGESGPVTATQHEQLGHVLRNGQSLLTLINTVMDLSKLEAGIVDFQQAEFALADLLNDVVSSVALQAEAKGLQLAVSVDPQLPGVILGDQPRLGQVLINLLNNAVKFTAQGTVSLTVRLGRRPLLVGAAPPPIPIVVPERQLGDRPSPTAGAVWTLEVADTGIGIAPEHQLVIFERFRQVEGPTQGRGGAGIGLAIVKKLVAGMGGELHLESLPGAGSAFMVVLPLRRPA